MLPVVANPNRVALEIVIYSYAMVASTLLLIPIQPMGIIYTSAAVLGGIWFIFEAHVLQNKTKQAISNNPMRLFHISISYLTILFIAVGVDPLVYVKIF
jgi:protoheme IX farnesyltransferase